MLESQDINYEVFGVSTRINDRPFTCNFLNSKDHLTCHSFNAANRISRFSKIATAIRCQRYATLGTSESTTRYSTATVPRCHWRESARSVAPEMFSVSSNCCLLPHFSYVAAVTHLFAVLCTRGRALPTNTLRSIFFFIFPLPSSDTNFCGCCIWWGVFYLSIVESFSLFVPGRGSFVKYSCMTLQCAPIPPEGAGDECQSLSSPDFTRVHVMVNRRIRIMTGMWKMYVKLSVSLTRPASPTYLAGKL